MADNIISITGARLQGGSVAEQLRALIPTNTRSHVTFNPDPKTFVEREKDGKITPQYYTVHSPVIAEHWERHLAGTYPIVAALACDDGTTKVSVVDIDDYEIKITEIVTTITRLAFPLYVRQSKSGGAHIYAFHAVPISIAESVKVSRGVTRLLGYTDRDDGIEYFPRVQKPDVEPRCLNMPYLGGEGGFINATGGHVRVTEFLSMVRFLTDDQRATIIEAKEPRKAKSTEIEAGRKYAQDKLKQYENELRNATSEGNNKLTKRAYWMGQMVARDWIVRKDVVDTFKAAIAHWSDLDKHHETLERSIRDGENEPHADLTDDDVSIRVEVGVIKETADAIEQALLNAECGLFVRGGVLVRVDYLKMKTWDEKKVEIQAIVECGDAFITETVASVSTFIKYDERKKADRRCNPPPWTASTLKQRKSRLSLPVLNGVSNCPIMRFNGELITEPGYNKETGLYFDPRGVEFPAIPGNPTKEEARWALDRLDCLFHTFPFVNKSSKSVALSALLTTVARRAVDTSPMHTFDSPTAGTGKSMIADTISIIATGDRANVLAMTSEPKEFDKLFSAELMLGRSVVVIDNCDEPLQSAVLNQALSQTTLGLRILGKSELVMVRSNAVVIANGNNLIIQGDLTRRTISGRMDAEVERPELLKFKYSPLDDARANRAELVMAVLTVLRAYHLAGRPVKIPLGSFDQWSQLIRGALIWLGEEDPAETMEDLRKNDPKLSTMRTLMFEWGRIWKPNTAVTVAEMVEKTNQYRKYEDGTGGYIHPEWRNVVMNVSQLDGDRLGKWLGRNKDRLTVFNNTGKDVTVKIAKDKLIHGRQSWVLATVEHKDEQQAKLL